MATSVKQTSLFTEEQSMCFPVDSLARMQVLQSKMEKDNKGLMEAGQDCLQNSADPLKKSNQNLLSPKMSLTFLELMEGQTLAQFSPNYPDWGIMQNGEFVMRQKSVRRIKEPGCISLLTPAASDYKRERLSFPFFTRRHHRSPGSLPEHLYRLFGAVPGRLNPQLYAYLMGYPVDWLENNYTDMETQ